MNNPLADYEELVRLELLSSKSFKQVLEEFHQRYLDIQAGKTVPTLGKRGRKSNPGKS